MDNLLLIAAALAVLLGVGHSYLGERYVLMRLFRRVERPKLFGSELFTRRVLRFAWHLTSVGTRRGVHTLDASGIELQRGKRGATASISWRPAGLRRF